MEYNYDKIESDFHEFKWSLGTIDDKLAIIDDKGQPVTDFIYKPLLYDPTDAKTKEEFENWKRRFGYDCLVFQKLNNNKMGVIDKDLKEIIPFIYDDIEIYQEPPPSLMTLFIAKKDSKYGLLNKDCELLLDFIYDEINILEITLYLENLPYGYAMVKKGDKYGLVNLYGKVVLDFLYDDISIHENFYKVKTGDKYKIIKRDLKEFSNIM